MNFREYIPFYKDTMRLAVPVMISQVGNQVVQLVDTLMVGRLGAEQLAAVVFTNLIFWLGMVFGMGITLGLTPLAGAKYTQRNFKRVGELFTNSLLLNFMSAIILMGLLMTASSFMDKMGQAPEIIPTARNYLFYMIMSMIPYMLFLTFKQFYEALGNTRIAMVTTIVGNLLNIGMNYCFIYGVMGAPEMGAEGAGFSTMLSRYIMMLMFIASFVWGRYRRYMVFMSFKDISRRTLGKLFNVGMPIAGQMTLEVSLFNIMGLFIGTLGATVLASHQIALNIPSFVYMIVVGLAAATTIRVSHEMGVHAYRRVKMIVESSVHLVIAMMCFTALCIILFRVNIASAFTPDEGVILLTSHLLIFAAIFQLPDGIQGVLIGGLRGLADVKVPVFIAFLTYIGIALPVGYICAFPLGMGADGAWVGFIVGLSVASVLFTIRFRRKYSKLIRSPKAF